MHFLTHSQTKLGCIKLWKTASTLKILHCMKKLHFPVFGLNTDIYFVNLWIQSKYWKIRNSKNSEYGYFSRSVVSMKPPKVNPVNVLTIFKIIPLLLSLRKKCRYSEFFWYKCGKMQTRITPNMGTFHTEYDK